MEDIYSVKERYYQLIPPLSFLFSPAIKNKIKATLKVQQIINIFYVGNKSEKAKLSKCRNNNSNHEGVNSISVKYFSWFFLFWRIVDSFGS